jgi:hypothetical protein
VSGVRSRPFAIAATLMAVLGGAWAQSGWSVQVVALRDAAAAEAQVVALRRFDLPAFTTPVERAGVTLTRVRIGCMTTAAAAERWATALAAVAPRGLVVALEGGWPIDGCIDVDVGFRKPASFALVSPAGSAPVFRVEVGGSSAFVRYGAEGWRLLAERPDDTGVEGGGFVQGAIGGVAWVLASDGSPLCPGRLIGEAGAAIVDGGDAVLACARVPPR